MFGNEEALTFRLEAKDLATANINKVNAAVAKSGTVVSSTTAKAVPRLTTFRNALAGLGPVSGAAGSEVGALASTVSMMPGPVGLAVAGVAAAGLVIGATTGAASDLNEEIQKSNVVFGESANSVQAFSKNAVAVGLSERAALGAAGAFGNMFNSTGLAQEESAKMSTTMVQLAADMASFNNEDPNEMLDKLRSGLAGEAEPLRRFGVLISEAAVKAFAYKAGIAEVGAELTDVQKVQARYGLILEKTKNQQGDVARSGDTLANAQRRFGAAMENLGATIGQVFLPAVAGIATGVADATTALSKMGDELAFLGVPFAAVGEAIGTFDRSLGNPGDWARSIHDFVDDTARSLLGLPAVVHDAFSGMTTATAEGWAAMDAESKAGYTAAQQAAAEAAAGITAEMKDGANAAAHEVGQIGPKGAQAILENQFHFNAAVDELRNYMENYLTPKQERMRIKAFLASSAVARGLASGRPAVVRETQRLVDAAQERLDSLDGHHAGLDAANTYISGMAEGIRGGVGVIGDALYYLKVNSIGDSPPRSGPMMPSRIDRAAKWFADRYTSTVAGAMGTALPSIQAPLAMATAGGGGRYGGGGGMTFVFNSTFPPTPKDADEIARRLFPAIEREGRRQKATR